MLGYPRLNCRMLASVINVCPSHDYKGANWMHPEHTGIWEFLEGELLILALLRKEMPGEGGRLTVGLRSS